MYAKLSSTLSILFLFFISNVVAQSTYIHVDQFGYLPSADKVAVLSNPEVGYNSGGSYTPSATIELRDASSDVVVFSAAPAVWNSGATHIGSGDKGWWFDFSSITTPGSYYVHDVGNNESSADFEISSDIYNDILVASGRMFYYNRCGTPKLATHAGADWADGISFTQDATAPYINDPNNPSLQKDLSGGWFDAGDYNKYVTFAHQTIHHLLWAYQENPNKFSDNWNIPESGNGIPDIIDEIKWELDFLLKMTNIDGSVHIKMGSQNHIENVSAPPSANNDTRFYGPTCTSASIANASMFAHAAAVLKEFPSLASYAQTLETNAETTWAYVLPHLTNNTLETNCDDGSIVAGDADWTIDEQIERAVIAAVYLFQLTDDNAYNQYVIDNLYDTSPMELNNWDNYYLMAVDALLLYTTLSGADASISTDIINSATTSVTNNWNNYFGWNTLDLYRAHMPNWSYHWGSNKPKASFGVLNNTMVNYGINSGSSASYASRAAETLHYFHGVNPLGLVYLSNMYDFGAERCANEIYHIWFADGTDWDNAQTSLYGPAPGYVPGGPNPSYTADVSLQPPYDQPLQKSYLDFNSNWPQNSWEITEPSITYQAAYLRLLASSSEDIALPVEWLSNPRAYLQGADIIVKWFTATEWYNEKFEVEHSLDGHHFEKLGSTPGSNNSETTQSYGYTHRDVSQGIHYYRIKQIDYDGAFQYSIVVSVTVGEASKINVYPNPVQHHFTIEAPVSEYQVQISDLHGNVLKNFQFSGANIQTDISSLSAGVYTVRIRDERSGFFVIRQLVKGR